MFKRTEKCTLYKRLVKINKHGIKADPLKAKMEICSESLKEGYEE
jgi:hypothetical protein